MPLPALSVLASAANNPNRRLSVLHILETTLINWQKQIKNVLNQQPESLVSKSKLCKLKMLTINKNLQINLLLIKLQKMKFNYGLAILISLII